MSTQLSKTNVSDEDGLNNRPGVHLYDSMAWYNNSNSLRPPLAQPRAQPRSEAPIYEDIDRMCSYRGYPPPTQQNVAEANSDSYYNLSGGSSSPRNNSSDYEKQPPQQPREAKAPKNSMYYYSDTLRKSRVGSDSGISVDTPPPRTSMQPRGRVNMVQTEAVLNERIRNGNATNRRKRTGLTHDTKV